MASQQQQQSKRGLASASEETRERVARAGGEAPHEKRGLQAASSETRQNVARKGGLARGEQRRRARQRRSSESAGGQSRSGEPMAANMPGSK
jgi:hypothetical protein